MKKIKLIFTADIHLGKTSAEAWKITAEKMKKENADIFVIGGDLSPSVTGFLDVFSIFSDVADSKYYVLGNHDVWLPRGGCDGESLLKYESLIDISPNGFLCLDKSPSIIECGKSIGLVGNIGWYDYSFRDKQIDILYPLAMKSYKKKRFPKGGIIWMDGEYVKWGRSDELMVDYFAQKLEDHIISVIDSVDVICCFMHHIPFEKMVKKGTEKWNMGNAFSGSKKIEAVIKKYDKIKYVFCGHSHTKFYGTLYGKECYNVGVDYCKPNYMVIEI